MTKIDDVIATIQAQSTMISGVQALVANLRQTVADLTAQHGADAELQAKIDEAFQDAQSNSAALAQAIATTPDGSAAAPVHVEDFTTAEQPPAAAPQADTSGGEPRG